MAPVVHKGNIGSSAESKSFLQKWDIIYMDTLNPDYVRGVHTHVEEEKPKKTVKRTISAA